MSTEVNQQNALIQPKLNTIQYPSYNPDIEKNIAILKYTSIIVTIAIIAISIYFIVKSKEYGYLIIPILLGPLLGHGIYDLIRIYIFKY